MAERTGTGPQRAYTRENVACSLISLLSHETVPVRIINQLMDSLQERIN